MKAASLHELKKELQTLALPELLELCMSLTRYKKDNKELLAYLLFEAHDKPAFIDKIKSNMDTQFEELPASNLYLIKKSLRKILRTTNKYIKYIGAKQSEAELLMYFCNKIKKAGIPIHTSQVLMNLYNQQIKKINKAVSSLHEDLQHDYLMELENLV